jgi:hypothetical protein
MALGTLKGVEKIGGFKVSHDPVTDYAPDIAIFHDSNVIAFNMQDGPIKESGVNGCQVDTLIEAAKLLLERFNKQIPCRETSMMITKLDEALMWSLKRKTDRQE